MVYYIFALFFFATSRMFATAEDDDITSCLELFKPENIQQSCCEFSEMLDIDKFESCKSDGNKWECENAKCILEKVGIMSGDTIDEKKSIELLENMKQKRPETKAMADRVRAECLDGKYEDYPPKDACPLMRFQICTYINAVVECDKWKTSDSCQKFSDNARTCKSVLEKVKE